MSWIKMRDELQTHPKVVRILSATRADKFRVVGGLHAVWCVFDQHSEDGILFGYTPTLLDHVIGWEGFSDAMISVGWLVFDGAQTLALPEFDEHNGQSAKRRAEDQKRKRGSRKVRVVSGANADKLRTESGLEIDIEGEKELTTYTPRAPAEISIVLRRYTINANPAHPSVIALAEQGIDLETLEACCKETREAKPNETISIGYIVKKLEGWNQQAAQVKVAGISAKPKYDDWHKSDAGIDRKGKELGMVPRGNENYAGYRERIWAEIKRRQQQGAAA